MAPQDITLRNAHTAAPSFETPAVQSDTLYAFTLTVSDGASNTATDTVVITVQGSGPSQTPPSSSPARLVAASSTGTAVTLAWADPGDPSITGYEIQYRIRGAPDFTVLVSDTGSTVTSYTVPNLEPNIMYRFRVSAINGGVTSAPFGTVTISTAAEPTTPPPPPAAAPRVCR